MRKVYRSVGLAMTLVFLGVVSACSPAMEPSRVALGLAKPPPPPPPPPALDHSE